VIMRKVWTTIIAALLLVTPWNLLASDTRAERLQEQRLTKSQNLRPPERSSLERFFYDVKQRRILERYQAGFVGFHPLIGGLSTGSGWAMGTQFRKTEILEGLLDFSASAQASFAAYQKYEMSIEHLGWQTNTYRFHSISDSETILRKIFSGLVRSPRKRIGRAFDWKIRNTPPVSFCLQSWNGCFQSARNG